MRTFTKESLKEVAFPLGGIGTGTVSLGGRGNLRDWEIFNRPGKGKDLPYTFFAVWAQAEGGEPVARVAERRVMPPFVDGRGLSPAKVYGLPRLEEVTFRGEYPFAWLDFQDSTLPVHLGLRAWNPFIPLDETASGLPVALFDWDVSNPTDRPVEVSLAFSLYNAAGYDGQAELTNRHRGLFGQNRNEWRAEGSLRGLAMSTAKYGTEDPHFGTLALLTPWEDVSYRVHWERAGWWDDLQSFWDDFRTDGRLPDDPHTSPTPDGQTDVGSLALRARLAPGERVTLPFVLAWHFPNLVNYWNREETVHGRRLGNFYATQWEDAWAAARYAQDNRDALEAGTEQFHRTLFESTLPAEVLDAVSSQMSIIRTTTCVRTADGRFHAFEGCNDNSGCCPMDCTHVWNYEQALAFLFPALERSMRLTDFGVNTRPDGRMAFRTLLPLSPETQWGGPPAADGQMGCVLKFYREWQLSGDEEFFRHLWPHARAALQYAWQKWDADRDGVMEGEQHNTYDIEFYGPNTMVGTLYLAALRAGARLARHAGEAEFAAECERLCAAGSRRYDEQLWNGEYYVQKEIPPTGPIEGLGHGVQSFQASGELRYQYGPGCLSDQLLGQWFARVVGLGAVLPEERVRAALGAIHRYNFRGDLSHHASCQRTYALNDEAGLLLCTWPHGGRPRYPFPYADEVWSGIEYQVAAHLIYEGLLEEGLEIVRGVRNRHDGHRRNPWDEFECGHHYARALASWSLLTALSGWSYSAPDRALGFAPRMNRDNFRCFFSTGSAWGRFAQSRDEAGYHATVTIGWGELSLQTLTLPLGSGPPVTVSVDGTALPITVLGEVITLSEPCRLYAGQSLNVSPA